ncbi:hypothetical protein TNIN_313981 [Trichonephila inaurata madagascariensis]|uniref:Uncharacterized protein n=1 Tax=Trichonephila inaurata madagascariensis TaxID=2747483 RepID=A0A8X6Y601_9ARAC|nr:hypothetical protein TNIN_313981 [Trichonephila inaurata madagascariensis]
MPSVICPSRFSSLLLVAIQKSSDKWRLRAKNTTKEKKRGDKESERAGFQELQETILMIHLGLTTEQEDRGNHARS